jgi:hypothetical protein
MSLMAVKDEMELFETKRGTCWSHHHFHYISNQSLIVRAQTIDYCNDSGVMQGTELWEIAK